MRRALVLALLAACVLAGGARADGDPASDFLLVQKVFLPYDAKLPAAKQRQLVSVVGAANRQGYKIRVALISSSYDLGSATALWRKPRTYARFLGFELQFVYKNRLLVVMPNGFGFRWPKHPATKEYALLSKIRVGPGAAGLADAATEAVQQLAAASGVKSAPTAADAKQSGSSNARDRIVIVVAVVAALVLLAALRLALRRRRPA